jgi:ABC-type multidrug transport system fused ATPase/permease subunit
MKNIWHVITLIPEYRGRLVIIFAASSMLGLVGTAIPYLFKGIVDTVIRLSVHKLTFAQAQWTLVLLILTFGGLRIATILFNYLLEGQSDALWLNTVSTLRQRVFDNMATLSLDYYERTRVGDVMDRYGAITSITMWLFQLSEGTLASILQLFFGITVLLVKAPAIGLIMLVLIPYNLFSSFQTVAKTKPLRRRWHQVMGKMAGLLSEMVSQIATVRSFAGERVIKRRFEEAQTDWWGIRTVEMATELRDGARLNLVNTIGVIASIAIVSLEALRGKYTAGDILLVLTLTQNLISAIQPITRLVNNTGDVETSAERLVELLSIAPSVVDSADAVALTRIESVEFRNVGFSYPGVEQPSLEGISFRLVAGEMLALVGPSGSGKSTLIKLLMRLYDPSTGQILVNDTDIRRYTQESLRCLMGIVLQDVALFNDTIGDNIAFARPEASLEEVQAAARSAHADAFIRNLPDRYETRVGERGIKLSGGEKQRVAIARALLRNPQLVILDEATSALDSESERFVQDGLEKLMRNRTAIVIAHRFSTIAKADKILVMQKGRIIETGDHGSLVGNREGLYARLYNLQVEIQGPNAA